MKVVVHHRHPLCQTTDYLRYYHRKTATVDYHRATVTTTEAACYDPKVQRSAPHSAAKPTIPTASTLNWARAQYMANRGTMRSNY